MRHEFHFIWLQDVPQHGTVVHLPAEPGKVVLAVEGRDVNVYLYRDGAMVADGGWVTDGAPGAAEGKFERILRRGLDGIMAGWSHFRGIDYTVPGEPDFRRHPWMLPEHSYPT